MRSLILSLLALSAAITPLHALKLKDTLPAGGQLFQTSYGLVCARIDNQKLQVVFLDSRQRVVRPKYAAAKARIEYASPRTKGQNSPMMLSMSLKDDLYLESDRPLKPPFNYFANITLSQPLQGAAPTDTLPRTHLTTTTNETPQSAPSK